MPFNGTGGFTVYTPGNPAVPGTAISSVAFNATMNDVATGLANTLTRDGQSPATANIPMGGNKITGLGPATVAGQAVRFEQLPTLATLGAAASGANGDITSLGAVASINGGQLAGLRNRIINGGMQVGQRGTSGTVNGYALDRWIFNYGGTQPTWTQSSSGVNVPWQGVTYTTINGIAGNTSINFAQRIEAINCRDMAGQTVTVSYWCYQNTGGAMTVTTGLNYPTAKDNYTSKTPISAPAGTSVPNGAWTKVTATFTVPTAATTGLELVCFNNAPAATAGIVYGLTAVQLELGSVTTPFEQRPYGMELALCGRYAQWVQVHTWGYATGAGEYEESNNPFRVEMRAVPSYGALVVDPSNTDGNSNGNLNTQGVQSVSLYSITYRITPVGAGAYYSTGKRVFVTAEL